jgi:endonuclease YncB( thermonuclease family)
MLLRFARRVRVVAALAFLVSPGGWAADYSGIVIVVRDGDTVQVRTHQGQKLEVRLNAIDAPEKAREGRRAQRFSRQSKAALARIAMNRPVQVEAGYTDRYGRHVGVLRVRTDAGEIDAGLMQVRLGMARIVPRYLDGLPAELRARYRDAEAAARSERRGLWSAARPAGAQAREPMR